MDKKKVLLPYNFTESDKKALDFVMENYAENKNIIITVLHFYSQVPEIILNRNSVMEKMSDGMHYLRARSKEQEDKIIAVKQRLLDYGVSNVNYLYSPKKRDVAQEICILARDEEYNTIILNHSDRITGFFKANVFSKVINTLKGKTVIVIT